MVNYREQVVKDFQLKPHKERLKVYLEFQTTEDFFQFVLTHGQAAGIMDTIYDAANNHGTIKVCCPNCGLEEWLEFSKKRHHYNCRRCSSALTVEFPPNGGTKVAVNEY